MTNTVQNKEIQDRTDFTPNATDTPIHEDKGTPVLSTSEVRETVENLLQQFGYTVPEIPSHADFVAECIAESEARGYLDFDEGVLKRFIPTAAMMARLCYSHQKPNVQVFIGLFTAFGTYVDDMFQKDLESVQQFNHKFITRQPQSLGLLDHFANLILEIPAHFGTIAANIMTTSTLNLVTSQSMEHEMEHTELSSSAQLFPSFIRYFSGADDAFAVPIFPTEMPIGHYIQALPDCAVYMNNVNDVLSFYKEQLAGETANRVHLTAKCRGVPLAVVLRELTDEALVSHEHIIDILAPHPDALTAWLSFSQGYIDFHFAVNRYRLGELDLGTAKRTVPKASGGLMEG